MPNDEFNDVSGLVGKNSGGDFTVAYASSTTLTLGTLPDGSSVTADDITKIVQFNSSGAVVAEWERAERTMSISGNTLTVGGAAFGASDIFVIYTNIPRESSQGSGTVPSVRTNGVEVKSKVVKASSGRLLSGYAQILKSAPTDEFWLFFLDASSLPSNGPVTHISEPIFIDHEVNSADMVPFDLSGSHPSKYGKSFSNGCVIALSTTPASLTLVDTAYLKLEADYE